MHVVSYASDFNWKFEQYYFYKYNNDQCTDLVAKLSPQRLKEMVMDVYHYPSKHTQVIMLVMERHDSERQEKRSV